MTPVAPVLPGETLGGKYRVERIIGRGGMGIVVAARHLDLDERVAIKFLVGDCPEAAVERFLREARAAAKVRGEHVCRVFDFGRLESGEPYMVMDHLEGTDLARKLDTGGPQSLADAAAWLIEACDALAEVHALGVVHRDIKPANIFLARRQDGSTCIKLLDFGISKLPKAESMTRTDALMGSPAYMSPEQVASAKDVDLRTDVWGLGVVLYELVAGRTPFVGQSIVDLALKIKEGTFTPLSNVRPEVPKEIDSVVARCLRHEPAERYPSVAELALALAPFAPPDVVALVARLEGRLDRRHSRSTLAFGRTSRDEDQPPPPSSDSAARVRATFAPLESKLGGATGSARRTPFSNLSKRAVPIGIALVTLLVIGLIARRPSQRTIATTSSTTSAALALTSGSAPIPAPFAGAPASVHEFSDRIDTRSAAHATDGSTHGKEGADVRAVKLERTVRAPSDVPRRALPERETSQPRPPTAPRASSEAMPRATARRAEAVPPTPSGTPAEVSPAPRLAPPTTPANEARKKRELDREDP